MNKRKREEIEQETNIKILSSENLKIKKQKIEEKKQEIEKAEQEIKKLKDKVKDLKDNLKYIESSEETGLKPLDESELDNLLLLNKKKIINEDYIFDERFENQGCKIYIKEEKLYKDNSLKLNKDELIIKNYDDNVKYMLFRLEKLETLENFEITILTNDRDYNYDSYDSYGQKELLYLADECNLKYYDIWNNDDDDKMYNFLLDKGFKFPDTFEEDLKERLTEEDMKDIVSGGDMELGNPFVSGKYQMEYENVYGLIPVVKYKILE